MPIIDAHTHIASWKSVPESERNLLEGMDGHGVTVSLVSHADCTTFPSEVGTIASPLSALEGLAQTLDFARRNPGRIYAAPWITPLREPTPSPELRALMENNRDLIKAIKIHPYCERIGADDPRLEPYYVLARELSLPLLVHCAMDEYSSIGRLVRAAKEHPDLRFVAAHMELFSDHVSTLEAMKSVPNLYADTAWVELPMAMRVLNEVGPGRIFFGTDAPIDGAYTLENPMYLEYLREDNGLNKNLKEALLYRNASAFYGIPTGI